LFVVSFAVLYQSIVQVDESQETLVGDTIGRIEGNCQENGRMESASSVCGGKRGLDETRWDHFVGHNSGSHSFSKVKKKKKKKKKKNNSCQENGRMESAPSFCGRKRGLNETCRQPFRWPQFCHFPK
jgi:hypothetical protein